MLFLIDVADSDGYVIMTKPQTVTNSTNPLCYDYVQPREASKSVTVQGTASHPKLSGVFVTPPSSSLSKDNSSQDEDTLTELVRTTS